MLEMVNLDVCQLNVICTCIFPRHWLYIQDILVFLAHIFKHVQLIMCTTYIWYDQISWCKFDHGNSTFSTVRSLVCPCLVTGSNSTDNSDHSRSGLPCELQMYPNMTCQADSGTDGHCCNCMFHYLIKFPLMTPPKLMNEFLVTISYKYWPGLGSKS